MHGQQNVKRHNTDV